MATKKGNAEDDFEKLLAQYDYNFKKGDLVKGTVCGFDSQGVLVDIGAKTTALIPTYEAVDKGERPEDKIEKGQSGEFLIIRDEDEDLSNSSDYRKKRADLRRRVNFIEEKKSDLYLSIHLNWYKDYYYGGAEILYNNINKNNKVLATNLKESLTNNNIKTRDLKTTNLYMYRNTNVVGVLVECGFLSNKNDRYLLKTKWYQEKFSKALVEGVIKYFN